jgi:DNA-binding transcriptional LysR family regulator
MLSHEQLCAYDYNCWFGNGRNAAKKLGINQSSVSRNTRNVLQIFSLRSIRGASSWCVDGPADSVELLQAERAVHQLMRLQRGSLPCRVEANYWAGPTLLQPLPEGWISGDFDLVGMEQPLRLLRDRVIDAWLGSYQPDLPGDDPELLVIDLLRMPLHLLGHRAHPLVGVQRLGPGDLAVFPSLSLPSGWFPVTESILKQQNLWTDAVRMSRYDSASWEGLCEDQITLTYGQCLSQAISKDPLAILDWDLGLLSGEALVISRDVAHTSGIQMLLAILQSRAAAVAACHADCDLVGG